MTGDGSLMAAPGRTDDVILAEKAVLASMIAYRDAAEELLELLGGEDCLSDGIHRAVYSAVRWLTEEAGLAERGTLRSGSAAGDESVQRRFAAVLARLVEAEQGIWHTGQAAVILGSLMRYVTPGYRADAAVVLRAARQRRTLDALDSARQAAARPGFDASEHGDMIRRLIDDALAGPAPAAGLVTAGDLFFDTLNRLETGAPPGIIQFPWADLRQLIPWLRAGQLVSVLARPSVGKSIFAADLGRYAGLHQKIPVILFTMEMDAAEVMDRLLAAETGVPHDRIAAGDLNDRAWERIAAAKTRFAEGELVIDDTPRISLAHVRARLRGMARTRPAGLAIIDYVQLMEPPHGSESREREVSALVGGLKAVAREFRIPVVMLGQLNRGPEHRQDKRPYLSDARESGSVENESDIAILIYRPDFHDPGSPRAGEADLIVDKHRGGQRGTVTVGFQGKHARFVDLAWTPSSVLKDSS